MWLPSGLLFGTCNLWHHCELLLQLKECYKALNNSGLLIFRAVAEPRISSKSAKSREIHKNTRNPAKFARNLTKYMSALRIWKLSWLLGLLTCCKLANLPWNFVTAARKQHDPKTTGVLTVKQRPGVPSVDRGNWGWECDRLLVFYVLALRENAAFCEGLRLIRSSDLRRWRSFFGTVRSTSDNAWKPAKWV